MKPASFFFEGSLLNSFAGVPRIKQSTQQIEAIKNRDRRKRYQCQPSGVQRVLSVRVHVSPVPALVLISFLFCFLVPLALLWVGDFGKLDVALDNWD